MASALWKIAVGMCIILCMTYLWYAWIEHLYWQLVTVSAGKLQTSRHPAYVRRISRKVLETLKKSVMSISWVRSWDLKASATHNDLEGSIVCSFCISNIVYIYTNLIESENTDCKLWSFSDVFRNWFVYLECFLVVLLYKSAGNG